MGARWRVRRVASAAILAGALARCAPFDGDPHVDPPAPDSGGAGTPDAAASPDADGGDTAVPSFCSEDAGDYCNDFEGAPRGAWTVPDDPSAPNADSVDDHFAIDGGHALKTTLQPEGASLTQVGHRLLLPSTGDFEVSTDVWIDPSSGSVSDNAFGILVVNVAGESVEAKIGRHSGQFVLEFYSSQAADHIGSKLGSVDLAFGQWTRIVLESRIVGEDGNAILRVAGPSGAISAKIARTPANGATTTMLTIGIGRSKASDAVVTVLFDNIRIRRLSP